jgi:hypothetical protein
MNTQKLYEITSLRLANDITNVKNSIHTPLNLQTYKCMKLHIL